MNIPNAVRMRPCPASPNIMANRKGNVMIVYSAVTDKYETIRNGDQNKNTTMIIIIQKSFSGDAGLEGLTAVIKKGIVFWVVMSCSSAKAPNFGKHITSTLMVEE